MDKKEILLQHNNIKHAIKKNIDTIKDLIEESGNIKKVIEQLSKQEFNKLAAQELDKVSQNINRSIKILLEQTNGLFDAYKKLIYFTFKQ